MAADVVLYTTPFCFYCLRAKQLLAKKGIGFRDVDVRAVTGARTWLQQTTGRTSVPQIFINGAFVGGYYELVMLERDRLLDSLLAEPGKAGEG
jgi:glutaredoxin 3